MSIRFAMRAIAPFALMLVARHAAAQGAPPPPEMMMAREREAAVAREKIVEGNRVWGRARIDLDRPTLERMLLPDAYVEMYDHRLTRKEFLDQIVAYPPGVKVTRFDVTVLTVTPDSNRWAAVIQEKMEMQRTAPDGKTEKRYFLWVTRDVWKPVAGQWLIASSTALANEAWSTVPPIPGW